MDSEKESTSINTYHCACSTLILATSATISSLPNRQETIDRALILPLTREGTDLDGNAISKLHNIVPETRAVVIRREDGFEKRQLLRCNRCDLVIGYYLDGAHFNGSNMMAHDVVYILPGSLVSTEGMSVGLAPETPIWAQKV